MLEGALEAVRVVYILNTLGLYPIIVDYCYNIRDASIISISENSNITDAYLSYELFFCFTDAYSYLTDEYIKMYHSPDIVRIIVFMLCYLGWSVIY